MGSVGDHEWLVGGNLAQHESLGDCSMHGMCAEKGPRLVTQPSIFGLSKGNSPYEKDLTAVNDKLWCKEVAS
jgi:hypothetical protein